jgi:D-beta-D-heptose 7-phosphate kinase/D-beta-D-heptose 1-phosphate adenosyltransferase
MATKSLDKRRLGEILSAASKIKLLVIGDVMLDHFVWGQVNRISPEAPVPIVDFNQESMMPGGAANVARNIVALGGSVELASVVGKDAAGQTLIKLIATENIKPNCIVSCTKRQTTTKMRVAAGQQQIVRVDRETRAEIDSKTSQQLLTKLEKLLPKVNGIIIADYGKGVVTQSLLNRVRRSCNNSRTWISVDPKPIHSIDISRCSLITPNRKEAFELAGISDVQRADDPLADLPLLASVRQIQMKMKPSILLVTLGELGMLLCQLDIPPIHIPTVAKKVFDVSGAGDTVIAAFTLATAAGASPLEAAVFSNQAAGIVVGKRGTSTVKPKELLASIDESNGSYVP